LKLYEYHIRLSANCLTLSPTIRLCWGSEWSSQNSPK